MAEKTGEKRKFPLHILRSTEAEIQEMVDDGYAKSKNAFINKAIEFYIGYLRNNKNLDYIAPILSTVMKSQMQSIEKNLSEILFKLAVEVAKSNHITAYYNEMTEERLQQLNDLCCQDVASNNGIIQFEDAYRFQHGEDGEY